MKKIVLAVLFCCLTLGLTACGSNSKAVSSSTTKSTEKPLTDEDVKKETDKLEALGLTKEQASDYHTYAIGVQRGIIELADINKSLESKDYKVSEKTLISANSYFNIAGDVYQTAVPSTEYRKFEIFLQDSSFAPANILKNCAENKRTIGSGEAYGLIMQLGGFAKEMLTAYGISEEKQTDLLDYYVSYLKYKGVFASVQVEAMENVTGEHVFTSENSSDTTTMSSSE